MPGQSGLAPARHGARSTEGLADKDLQVRQHPAEMVEDRMWGIWTSGLELPWRRLGARLSRRHRAAVWHWLMGTRAKEQTRGLVSPPSVCMYVKREHSQDWECTSDQRLPNILKTQGSTPALQKANRNKYSRKEGCFPVTHSLEWQGRDRAYKHSHLAWVLSSYGF